jgi:hypothetical protein
LISSFRVSGLIFFMRLLWKKLAPESQIVLYEKTVRIRRLHGQDGNVALWRKGVMRGCFSKEKGWQ